MEITKTQKYSPISLAMKKCRFHHTKASLQAQTSGWRAISVHCVLLQALLTKPQRAFQTLFEAVLLTLGVSDSADTKAVVRRLGPQFF